MSLCIRLFRHVFGIEQCYLALSNAEAAAVRLQQSFRRQRGLAVLLKQAGMGKLYVDW